jgi:hypothetical protein
MVALGFLVKCPYFMVRLVNEMMQKGDRNATQ